MKTTAAAAANAILAALVAVIAAAPASAAVPEAVTYAGELRQGNQPADGVFSAIFNVFDTDVGGASLFEQDEPSLVVSGGELVVDLGRSPSNTLDDDLLAGGRLFLQITVNGEVLEPRVPFTSVPYARRAAVAEVAENADFAEQAHLAQSADNADLLQGLSALALLDLQKAGTGLTKIDNVFKVAPSGITSVEIAAGAVKTDELANGAVNAAKVQDGTLTKQKVNGGVAVVQGLAACGSNLMLTNGGAPLFCTSIVCGTHHNSYITNNEDVAPTFYACDGSCNQNAPQSCRVSSAPVGVMFPN